MMQMSTMAFINILLICSWLSITTALVDDTRTIDESAVRGIAQRPLCTSKKDYDFITEYKRLPEHRYVTEYKRFPEYRYSFGIGKRWLDDSNIKRTLPYSFGVGKRSTLEPIHPMQLLNEYLAANNNDNNNFLNNDVLMDDLVNKRNAAPLRPYDFGIGKRNKIRDELRELDDVHSNDYNSENNHRRNENVRNRANTVFNGAEQLLEQY